MDNDLKIIFKKSAFRHGVIETDIRWAFTTVEVDELIHGFENKYRLLGFNTKGNMIEVLYNLIDDHRINVFHAFPCSDAFLKSFSNRSN